jgi:hypothetical protein
MLVSRGRIAVAVWIAWEHSEAYPMEVALLERLAGQEAADALRAPFVLGDRGKLSTLFGDPGCTSVTASPAESPFRWCALNSLTKRQIPLDF